VICGTAGATYGSVWRHLALLNDVLGRTDEAVEHFERAIAAHRSAGALPYLAHTQREFASMLIRRGKAGDGERADELLAAAIDTYRRLGMAPWAARAESLQETPEGPGARTEFRREGDVWSIEFAGRAARLKDSKGLRNIAHLLGRPGVEVHCSELVAAADRVVAGRSPSDRELAEAGLSVGSGGDAGEVLDARAREEYRARLVDLRAELEDAQAANDPERAARASADMDFLERELAAAFGLGARARKAGDPGERARKAVAERIRAAVARVLEAHPALGRHLENSIRTGTFCSYQPEAPVVWVL